MNIEVTNAEFFKHWDEADAWQFLPHSDRRRCILDVRKDGRISHYITKDVAMMGDAEFLELRDGLRDRLQDVSWSMNNITRSHPVKEGSSE